MADENKFGDIIKKCWDDDTFKKRFVSEPKKVLAEFGMDVPDGLNVKVVENTDDTMYLTLPPRPGKAGELSDNQLEGVSGGAGTLQAVKVNQAAAAKIRKILTTPAQTCSSGKECCPW
jgi:hypothetical protein